MKESLERVTKRGGGPRRGFDSTCLVKKIFQKIWRRGWREKKQQGLPKFLQVLGKKLRREKGGKRGAKGSRTKG